MSTRSTMSDTSTHTSGGRRSAVRRIALLVALGIVMGLASTDAGRALTCRAARSSQRLDVRVPQRPDFAYGSDLRFDALRSAFEDMCAEGEPGQARALPTPELVASRLAGIDGWTTAVLYEYGSDAGDLYRAGLADALTCTELCKWIGTDTDAWIFRAGPARHWRLALLDGRSRYLGAFDVTALRGGFELREHAGEMVYFAKADVPGDGPLPAVSVFHRDATGEVRPG